MTTMQIRKLARRRLDALPVAKVRVAADFLAFLEYGAQDEATAELLQIPGLTGDLKEARKDQAAGRGVNWRKVRRDV